MTEKNRSIIKNIFIILVVLGISFVPGNAYICENGAGSGYEEGNPDGGTASYLASMSIESYIETGAGYFLKSKEDTGALLRMVELQNVEGVNLEEMKNATQSALNNIQASLDTYNALVGKAETTPYNSVVIEKLNQFNYEGFAQDNQINGFVWTQVEGYLKNGDITGIFKRKKPVFEDMIAAFETVKSDLENNVIPDISGLWEINETFSEMSLFGSYVARVFHEIE
jgi:hypothetical protein